MSFNISNLPTIIKRLPTYARGTKLLNLMATIEILENDVIIFKQRDILATEETGNIVIMANSVIQENLLSITITYNTALTIDFDLLTNQDIYTYVYSDTNAYQITNIDFKSATPNKGKVGDKYEFYALTGFWAKVIFLHETMGSYLRNNIYTFLRYLSLSEAADDWVDQKGESWGLRRLPGESDADYKKRIVSATTSSNGTIDSILERVKVFLDLPDETVISVTESYNQSGWILNQSKLLAGGQSELILTGGDSIKPMQFVMTIPYSGSLTEEEVETFLYSVINVGATPIVRFS